MYVHYDVEFLQGIHGVTEEISGGCLHDVFHEFRTVEDHGIGFDWFVFEFEGGC